MNALMKSRNEKVDVVLLHGWGLNSGIWSKFIALANEYAPQCRFIALDLPGYGSLVDQPSSSDLAYLADSCLARAPDAAIWVGWSLGGMVALTAAMRDHEKKIQGLYLITTSPCFVTREGWPSGVDLGVFQRFADELSHDYRSALSTFILLQSGANKGARTLAREAHRAVCALPDPSKETLQLGIECLAMSDLRNQLIESARLAELPSQVLACTLDRVAKPQGCEALAEMLRAGLTRLNTGHAPFLTQPTTVLDDFLNFLGRVYASE